MDPTYERGWQRYGFDNIDFADTEVHGADVLMKVGSAFNRGPGNPQISFGIVPPGGGSEPIGMHIHRDLPTDTDVEEWYVIIEGAGEMTFSNGDSVQAGPGDVIATYPGTGHSFRATGSDPVRLVAVVPRMFTTAAPVSQAPAEFHPRIRVDKVHPTTLNPIVARCKNCGQVWNQTEGDRASAGLAVWAREHEGTSSG